MKVLLLRPHPGNDPFGLVPFFCVEPLGLEYIGAALIAAGHEVVAADLRFGPGIKHWMRRSRPRLVGITCPHALEYNRALATAREVRRISPEAFIVIGGHAAAAFPAPLEQQDVDAVSLGEGEETFPLLAETLERGGDPRLVPGLRIRTGDEWITTSESGQPCLDLVPLPARHLMDRYRNRYHCLLFKPVWLIETARGCPHHCSFCSVWQLYGRTFRERGIGAVVEDFATAGDSIFVADDLFWNNAERGLELALALKKRGIRKRWILVQSRTDVVSRNPELLDAWRPLAKDFDIFMGLEAATDHGLAKLDKDTGVEETTKAVSVARAFRFGINGNFLIDPDWEESDFHALWDFINHNGLQRSGFTILTPLPGTEFYDQSQHRSSGQPWANFDMHHLLWEPRLGAERFFELYAETWRRSILNTSGDKSIWGWVSQVSLSQIPYIVRVLWRTQNMMSAAAYISEHNATRPPVGGSL